MTIHLHSSTHYPRRIHCTECHVEISRKPYHNKPKHTVLTHPLVAQCSRSAVMTKVMSTGKVKGRETGIPFIQVQPPNCPKCRARLDYSFMLGDYLRVTLHHVSRFMPNPINYASYSMYSRQTEKTHLCMYSEIRPIAQYIAFL